MIKTPHPYWEWEEYGAGIYAPSTDPDDVETAVELLSNAQALRAAMIGALHAYPKSAEHHLSLDEAVRPWLGSRACFVLFGIPENETRAAWGMLNEPAQIAANGVADSVALQWRKEREGAETLFA